MRSRELNTTISLQQRLLRDEDSRTIALAIRTFRRASIDKEILKNHVTEDRWKLIEPIIDDLIAISRSPSFDKARFLDTANLLSHHLSLA